MSKYKELSADELNNLFSNYLINSWSYSKVMSFARNEKGFEMNYIYNIYSKSSPTTIAGQAYHEALKSYFYSLQQGIEMSLAELEAIAYDYLNAKEANQWKLGKTTPTVEDCIKVATKHVTTLLNSFVKEVGVYTDEIAEIIYVEQKIEDWIKVNGVEIPLPCHVVIDLCVKTKDGKRVLIDHKSKATFTDDEEVFFVIGSQAITYALVDEAANFEKVDEVWFIENKTSINKDGSPQLARHKIPLTDDTRRLYEALLYEPLRRMLEATSNPDYVYLINHSDSFQNKAEIYDFWAKTQIAELSEFSVAEDKKELIANRIKKIRDSNAASINPKIIKQFREKATDFIQYDLSTTNMTEEEKIEHVLRTFGIISKVAHKFEGYSSNTYLLDVTAGTKIASVYSHRLDIASALNVSSVRMSTDLIMHGGRSYLGIDFVKKRDKTLLFDKKDLVGRKIPLGKDNFGNVIVWDLDNQSSPHMIVCGATGSGKSVFIRSIIQYALMSGVDYVVILDPKHEFVHLDGISNVFVHNEIEHIEKAAADLVEKMNGLVETGGKLKVLIIIDEAADAIASSKKGKELNIYEDRVTGHYANGRPKTSRVCTGQIKSLEENIQILAQKSRSVGFRIAMATQRASTKIINGDTKANFPIQVCFRVPKEIDSRVVLDEAGAESLAGMGDGLIKSPEYPNTVRFQAYYTE